MDSLASFRRVDPGDDHPEGAGLSRGLGWFSIGLGLAELAVPRALAQTIGVDPNGHTSTTLRIMGVRELVSGLGILMQPRRPLPLWSRVAGDVLDLALLTWAAGAKRTSTQRIAAALATVVGTTALDFYASRKVTRAQAEAMGPVMFSITVAKPPQEVYAFWRNLENLPRFMNYLESVREQGTRSHWVAKPLVGPSIEWDAEIIDDRPGELISWRSVEGSTVPNRGTVSFAKTPGRDMTEVRVEIEAGLPGIEPNALLAKLMVKPQVKGDLRRFKQVIETGEVVYSDASIHKRSHAAQPSLASAQRGGAR